MDALTEALATKNRMLAACRAAVMVGPSEVISGLRGLPMQQAGMNKAAEQLKHFSGWSYAAIRVIAQRIAGQPIRLGRVVTERLPGRSKQAAFHLRNSLPNRMKGIHTQLEPMLGHPLLDLLADPSPLGTAWTTIYATVCNLLLTGRAFWWLTEFDGRPQLFWLPSSWIEGFEGSASYQAWHVRTPGSAEAFTIPAESMTYFHLPHPADPHGALSPLQAQAEAVTTDEHLQRAQRQVFERGIHPTHAIHAGRLPGTNGQPGQRPVLTAAQRTQLVTSVLQMYEGFARRGEPLIVDGLIEKVERLTSTPQEMDFLNSSKLTKERILLGFGVNGAVIGQLEGANRASSYIAESHLCDNAVNPLIELMSAAATEWLAGAYSEDEKLCLWIEPCTPHDAEMNLKRVEAAARHGLATVDELREMLNLAPADSVWIDGEQPPRAESRMVEAFTDEAERAANETFGRWGLEHLNNHHASNGRE